MMTNDVNDDVFCSWLFIMYYIRVVYDVHSVAEDLLHDGTNTRHLSLTSCDHGDDAVAVYGCRAW